jgi:hypothetical protein
MTMYTAIVDAADWATALTAIGGVGASVALLYAGVRGIKSVIAIVRG